MTQSLYKSFFKDNSIVIAGHILVYMKGIILMPVIIKTTGVTIYGGFVLLTSILGIIFGISSFGAGFRATRFLPSTGTMQGRKDLFYPPFFFQLLSIVFFSILLICFNEQLNKYFFKNEISYNTFIIPLYLISYFLFAQGCSYFRYTSRVQYMTLAEVFSPYIHIGIIFVFLYFYDGININMLMLSYTASAIIIAIPCFWVVFQEIGMGFSFYTIKNLLADIKIGFPLVLGFILDFILAGSDRYFIALYLTVKDVGYYTPAYVLGSLIIFIPKAMGTVLPQLLSKAVDNKNELEAERMLNYALEIFLLLAIPFIFGCIALGKPILTLLTNQEVSENAFWITSIAALAILFYGLNIILSNVLFVRMKTYAMFKMNIFASVFSLLANAVFLYFFKNILVAAITNFASYFLVFLFINKIVNEENWHVDFQPVVILKSLVASIIMFTLLVFIPFCAGGRTSLVALAVKLILGCSLYFIGLFALRTFSKKELQFIRGYFFR